MAGLNRFAICMLPSSAGTGFGHFLFSIIELAWLHRPGAQDRAGMGE